MKPRNFYLFVAVLALWVAWAGALPARLLAAAGHDEYRGYGDAVVWHPVVDVADVAARERTRNATARAIIDDLVLRTRIQDQLGEAMGGFHWHGPIPSIVTVKTIDGGSICYRIEKGSARADYLHGRSRDASGDLLLEPRRPHSSRSAG